MLILRNLVRDVDSVNKGETDENALQSRALPQSPLDVRRGVHQPLLPLAIPFPYKPHRQPEWDVGGLA